MARGPSHAAIVTDIPQHSATRTQLPETAMSSGNRGSGHPTFPDQRRVRGVVLVTVGGIVRARRQL